MTLQENPRQQRPWNAWGFTETAGIQAIQARRGRQSANRGYVKTNGANGHAREAHQRVLLSGGQVQGGVVQAVHKVPQARHVHLILHGLQNGSTRWSTVLIRQHLISFINTIFCNIFDKRWRKTYSCYGNQNLNKETGQGMLDVLVFDF